MPEHRFVAIRREGAVCVLTLRREEKLNALSSQVEAALAGALESKAVRESRCVVLTGGTHVFSAGADVHEMRAMDPDGVASYYRATGEVYERVAALPQPTVSAINGYCLGGGLELALATDFRVAGQSATFGLPEVRIGIVPSSGGTYRLVRALGPARAREWILLRPRFTAAEALAHGLLTEVVPDGEVLARALAMATELAALPPLAAALAKSAIDRCAESSREAALAIERLTYGMLVQSEDARRAMAAFVERLRPRAGAGDPGANPAETVDLDLAAAGALQNGVEVQTLASATGEDVENPLRR